MTSWHWYNANTNTSIIQTNADVLKAASFSNHVNTIIRTSYQLKFFIFWVPTLQSPETNIKLAIRPKTIISSMFVLIPAINENKRHINCLYPFFPFAQWTQWRTAMIHRLVFHSFYWLKADKNLDVVYNSV